jgi:hypothetical protein
MSTKQPPGISDLGEKVSIRLHDPEGGYRDLLGILVEVDSVQKKDGSIHKFKAEQIAMWKVVPQPNQQTPNSAKPHQE